MFQTSMWKLTVLSNDLWNRHNIETLSASLALYDENPLLTGGFSSQMVSDTGLFFLSSWICWTTDICVSGNFRRHDAHMTSLLPVVDKDTPDAEKCTYQGKEAACITPICRTWQHMFNTLRPKQNCLNKMFSNRISLKFHLKVQLTIRQHWFW